VGSDGPPGDEAPARGGEGTSGARSALGDADALVLTGGRLFPATGGDSLLPNPGIVIRNGVLAEVGADLEGRELSSATVVELEDHHVVLPGFVDVHAHYAVDLFGEGRVDEYEVNPVVFLANGVTTTFPAGEVDPEGMARARRRIGAGEAPGPRIVGSGPYFGTARPGWRDEAVGPDSVRAEVDRWAATGVGGFKAKGIRGPELAALIDQAHRHGLSVTAHLGSGHDGSVNPAHAIRMGIDRVEHFLGGDLLPATRPAYASLEALDLDDPEVRRELDETVRLYVERGVFFDATRSAYGYFAPEVDPRVYEQWTDEARFLTPYARSVVEERLPRRPLEQFARIYRVKARTVRAFYEGGGDDLLTVGTDHPSWGPFLSGFGIHRELHALVRAGIPAAGVLRAATANGARALGLGERLGTVEPGRYADLVVVEGDPLEEIRNTRNVVWVVRAGRLHDPRELLESVEGDLGPGDATEASWWKGRERLGG